MITRERSGRSGRPRILAYKAGTSARLYHFHGGMKMLARACYGYLMVNGRPMKIQVGRRCPICGLIPNDLVSQEQQEALEQMLLSGFKNRPRRRA